MHGHQYRPLTRSSIQFCLTRVSEMLGDGFVMQERALWPALVYAGVISATLSSALGSMMGAPRILQEIGRASCRERV